MRPEQSRAERVNCIKLAVKTWWDHPPPTKQPPSSHVSWFNSPLMFSLCCRVSLFVAAADQPVNEVDTRFALAVVELQVIISSLTD